MNSIRLPLFAALLLFPAFGGSADIVALCIGNDAYLKAEDRLDTSVADATLMRDTLRAVPGVGDKDVVLLANGTDESMRAALRDFREKARGARLAILYYSGHSKEGQPGGHDREDYFLLPVDAVIDSSGRLTDRVVGLAEILDTFRGLPPAARAVVLDAGGPNAATAMEAFAGILASEREGSDATAPPNAVAGTDGNAGEGIDHHVARALGPVKRTGGTLIASSAGPGQPSVAFLNEADTHSPYTRLLAKGIREHGGDLFGIASFAARETREATGGRQVPWAMFVGDPSQISAVRLEASQPAGPAEP